MMGRQFLFSQDVARSEAFCTPGGKIVLNRGSSGFVSGGLYLQ